MTSYNSEGKLNWVISILTINKNNEKNYLTKIDNSPLLSTFYLNFEKVFH